MDNVTASPLAWPPGKPRTPWNRRVPGRFSKSATKYYGDGSSYKYKGDLSVADAHYRLRGELDRLGASSVVLSTNLDLRIDGMPRSNQRKPEDPGVALYFKLKARPIVLACDQYTSVEANIAAIAAHIDAMRTTERHGVGSLEQMFMGFAALPPAIALDDWRQTLDYPKTVEEAERFYRDAMQHAHPDKGGTEALAAKFNAAITLAREYFEGK